MHNETSSESAISVLDEFIEAHMEIGDDIINELKVIEKFLDGEPPHNHKTQTMGLGPKQLKCAEIIMNANGDLLFRCFLCMSERHEFQNFDDYEHHLNEKHAPGDMCKNIGVMDKSDQVWVSELHKMFMDEMDKHFIPQNDQSSSTATSIILEQEEQEESTVGTENNDTTNTNETNTNNNNTTNTINTNKKKKKRTPGYCEICNRTFNDLYNLRIHKMIHTGEMPFQCEECGKRFRQLNKLNIHRITHTNKKPFVCDICGKGFRFRNYLSVHKRLHSGEKPYKCAHCEEHFHSLHNRRLHLQTQHSVARTYVCEICDKVLTSQCYLTEHLKRHRKQRDFPCERCGKCFYTQCQLRTHELSHTSKKPYECEVCHVRFQRKSNYTQHRKIHADVKAYICRLCHKAFAQNAGLYAHMKSHVETTTKPSDESLPQS